MAPKAITTRYAGYRFRSRLEARWAVVFDALGWDWDYEVEGFELPSGWYLPDFRLPGLWVEIKPSLDRTAETYRAMTLVEELAEASGDPAAMLWGTPAPWSMGFVNWPGFGRAGSGSCSPLSWFGAELGASQEALRAGRSARFEFGETPRRRAVANA